MSNKFNILFSGAPFDDALNLCNYIDEFYHSCGLDSCDVDLPKLIGLITRSNEEFPSPLGVDKSSPFKKAAAFTCNFVAERPIHTALPIAAFGRLSNHHNSIVAIALAIDSLDHAVIKCQTRGDIVLSNRITLSNHYWKDLVAAVSGCVPVHHFECLSLIFEALAYQANPNASYDRII